MRLVIIFLFIAGRVCGQDIATLKVVTNSSDLVPVSVLIDPITSEPGDSLVLKLDKTLVPFQIHNGQLYWLAKSGAYKLVKQSHQASQPKVVAETKDGELTLK